MKSTELMIGDWVYYYDGKPVRVLQLSDGKDCPHIKPIPLTPEILEKNGFKEAGVNDNEPSGLCGRWWSKNGLILVKMFKLTLMKIVFSVSGNNSRISNIRYVHELQHALRLCGIDKEITIQL